MKTIFKIFLLLHSSYKDFWKNSDSYVLPDDPYDYISAAFCWHYTPSPDRWAKLAYKWEKIVNLFNR